MLKNYLKIFSRCMCLCMFWSTHRANLVWWFLMQHFPWRQYTYFDFIFWFITGLLWWMCKWVLPAGVHSQAKNSRPEILFRSSFTKLVPDTGGSVETTKAKNTSVTGCHLCVRQEVVRRVRRIRRAHIHRHTRLFSAHQLTTLMQFLPLASYVVRK